MEMELKKTYRELRKKNRKIGLILLSMIILYGIISLVILFFLDRMDQRIGFSIFIVITAIFVGFAIYLAVIGLKSKTRLYELQAKIKSEVKNKELEENYSFNEKKQEIL